MTSCLCPEYSDHLQMRGASPSSWSDFVGTALHWLGWASHLTPVKLIQNVPKPVLSMPPPISLLESIWMMPAIRWCASEAVLLLKVWLNGPGVAETALQVQTVHRTWVQCHTEILCFAYDVPSLCRFVSLCSFLSDLPQHFQSVYWVLHMTSTTLLQHGSCWPPIMYLKLCQFSGIASPRLVLPPEVPMNFYWTECRDCGSSPWMLWSGWLIEPHPQHQILPVPNGGSCSAMWRG